MNKVYIVKELSVISCCSGGISDKTGIITVFDDIQEAKKFAFGDDSCLFINP